MEFSEASLQRFWPIYLKDLLRSWDFGHQWPFEGVTGLFWLVPSFSYCQSSCGRNRRRKSCPWLSSWWFTAGRVSPWSWVNFELGHWTSLSDVMHAQPRFLMLCTNQPLCGSTRSDNLSAFPGRVTTSRGQLTWAWPWVPDTGAWVQAEGLPLLAWGYFFFFSSVSFLSIGSQNYKTTF